ncbi:hypothetical protein ACFYY8_21290 [Streptosporangium sp. NPDC001559]|uniref:hypothetical protein n=1 Tax=Streptosporangium sp. NPDC001559 TaxID=3366187 RepID=UPI0036ED5330
MSAIKRVLAALTLVVAALAGLVSPAGADVASAGSAPTTVKSALAFPTVSPVPEFWDTRYWTQDQATEWVNNCASGRLCTWIRNGSGYALFQFYNCTEYALARWEGTTPYFNNQNVRVELRDQYHRTLRYMEPGAKFITNWDAVWFINLCA